MATVHLGFVRQVKATLNPTGNEWDKFSVSTLLELMDSRIELLWMANVQAAVDYCCLAGFAAMALVQHPNVAEQRELLKRVKREMIGLENAAYGCPLTQTDRFFLYKLARRTPKIVRSPSNAPYPSG
jgi:hypothetical protein